MRRRSVAAFLAVVALLLPGCAGGPTLGGSVEDADVFSREQTSADLLPDDVLPVWDSGSSRYVGEDSAGDRYWAARDGERRVCIASLPAGSSSEYFTACGSGGLSATNAEGVRMEFATAPQDLNAETSELIGDTLLVRRP